MKLPCMDCSPAAMVAKQGTVLKGVRTSNTCAIMVSVSPGLHLKKQYEKIYLLKCL
jgi:hypothetical protein